MRKINIILSRFNPLSLWLLLLLFLLPRLLLPWLIKRWLLLLSLLLLYAVPCLADENTEGKNTDSATEEEIPFSILTVHYSDDDAGGNSVSIEANLGLPDGYRVTLGGGDDFTAEYRTETKTSAYHVGISSDPQKPVSVGLDYQQWGRVDSLTTETWRLDLGGQVDNFQIRVATEKKTVHVYDILSNVYDVDSDSYSLNLGYSDVGKWFVNAGYKQINYDKDLRQATLFLLRQPKQYFLLNGRLVFILSPPTLQLLTTLDESQTTFTAGIDIGEDQFGVDWLSSEAVFESVSYTITSVYYDKVLSEHWSANLRFGRQQTDSSRISDLDIYSLSLSYIW